MERWLKAWPRQERSDLLILSLFDDFLGKWFLNNGDRYEGEYINGIMHGKGKKQVIYFMIYLF